MRHRKMFRGIPIAGIVLLSLFGIGIKAQQDNYTVKVPEGWRSPNSGAMKAGRL
jgi:hypothetical protein